MVTRLLNGTKLSICFLFLLACSPAEKKQQESTSRSAVVLAPEDFKSKLSSTSDAIIIDVRTPEELQEGVIEGAVNIDFNSPSFADKIAGLNKDKTYFVYCLSGKRSAKAIAQMEISGFEHLYTLDGGIKNWIAKKYEIVKP